MPGKRPEQLIVRHAASLLFGYELLTKEKMTGRSPCPMVNTLANHGYLPRDGLNITMAILVAGLLDGVNLAEPATRLVGAKALEASTTGNPETFNLDDLNRHGGCMLFPPSTTPNMPEISC